jgi:formate dehydrogenase maturation protein FdhE
MLGLRYFACQHCETVYALPEVPDQCGNCGRHTLADLSGAGGAEQYFAPADDYE